jgi:DNA replication initiation complex subunit (GINS family)
MAGKDVVITYETLFEMLRLEKNREELQKVSPSFFTDVLGYVDEKRRAFGSRQNQEVLFSADDKDKIRLELDNIKKILKDLYDRREKKLVSMALNKAKTGVMLINTSNMLPSEKLLFDALDTTLCEFRKSTLFKLAAGEIPDVGSLHSSLLLKLNSLTISRIEEQQIQQAESTRIDALRQEEDGTDGVTFRRLEEPKELKTTPNLSDSNAASRKVRFLAPIEEIVGPDLQIYGPYDKDAVITLPRELARVLVEKKQVEEI